MIPIVPPGRLHYAWIVVAVTVSVIMATAGLRATPGAWLLSMRDDLGWSTATLSLAAAIGLVVYGLAAPVAGVLIQRYGMRAVAVASLLASALVMLLTSLVQSAWQMHLVFGLGSGLASGLVGGVMGAVVANRWFVRHRGLVIGIMGGAVSAGQLVFYPLLTLWAVELGWRSAALLLGLVCLALAGPVALLMRDGPERVGLAPVGGSGVAPPAPPEPARAVMRRAAVSPTFWLLCLTFYACGATSNGIVGQHFIPHAVDHGFTAGMAATALAIVGAFNFVGTIASGWLTDRFDPRKLLLVYYVLRGVSLVALPFVHENVGLIAFSVLFGLDYIATVPPTVALAADTFGRRNVGVVYGWIFAAHQLGAAMAAWGAGLARDAAGDYVVAFFTAGILAMLAGGMAMLIRRAPSPEPAVA
jgi:sugar phosphate permease